MDDRLKKKDCAAFPRALAASYPGMSLRDYFAGQALAGLMSKTWPCGDEGEQHEFSAIAYQMADAMLAERETE